MRLEGPEMTLRPDGERLAILETKVQNVQDKVDTLSADIKLLMSELQRREGAQKVAQWGIGLMSGAGGAALIKFFPWLGSIPK